MLVWGCFSGEMGTAGSYFLEKNVSMNVELYKNVLEYHMILFYEFHENVFLLQDSAPFHTAR